jgi:hypothetical protein
VWLTYTPLHPSTAQDPRSADRRTPPPADRRLAAARVPPTSTPPRMFALSMLVKNAIDAAGMGDGWDTLLRKPRLDDGTVMDKADVDGRPLTYPWKKIAEHGIFLQKHEDGIQLQTWKDGTSRGGAAQDQTHIAVVLNGDATEVLFGSLDEMSSLGGVEYEFRADADVTPKLRARWLNLVSTAFLEDMNTINQFAWDHVKGS